VKINILHPLVEKKGREKNGGDEKKSEKKMLGIGIFYLALQTWFIPIWGENDRMEL
jgi:hypothetical protein